MSVLDIAKRIFGKDEFDEFDISLDAMDGCEGEETIAKIRKMFNKDEPC